MKSNDYKTNDTTSVYVKVKKVDEIIRYYEGLGWRLIKKEGNKKYEDIVDLTFSRAHKIQNKDELQILQVYMEERVNNLAKLEKNKHSKTLAFGLSFGVLGLAFLVFGILSSLYIFPYIGAIVGGLSIAIGLAMIISCIIVMPKLFKKEKQVFKIKSEEITSQLSTIFAKAQLLVGENDEK